MTLPFLCSRLPGNGRTYPHVASLLHGDDPRVIFFVHPHKEVLFIVVKDTATVWPISSHTS